MNVNSIKLEASMVWALPLGGAIFIAMSLIPIIYQALLFFLYVILIMKVSEKKSVLSPNSWFGIFVFLYSASYPLYITVIDEQVSNPFISDVLPLSFLAYLGFLLPFVVFTPRNACPAFKIPREHLSLLFYFSLVICSILVTYIFLQNISSKREFIDFIRSGSFEFLFMIFTFSALLYALKLLQRREEGASFSSAIFKMDTILIVIIFMIGFGVTGERDYIFRLGFLTFLVLFVGHKSYTSLYLLFVVSLVILVMPLSQMSKAYLISGEISIANIGLRELLYSEFSAAGRNINYVITNHTDFFYGETFVWDIKRYLGFMFPDQISTGMWFNNDLRYLFGDEGSSGWGFSLVAEGYINFGWYGPPALFFFLGLITKLINRTSRINMYFFSFYIIYIPTFIYVIRADFANFLSLNFKLNIAMVVFLYFSVFLIKRLRLGNFGK